MENTKNTYGYNEQEYAIFKKHATSALIRSLSGPVMTKKPHRFACLAARESSRLLPTSCQQKCMLSLSCVLKMIMQQPENYSFI